VRVFIVLSEDYEDAASVESVFLDEDKASNFSKDFNDKKRSQNESRRSDVFSIEVTK
jgi:hypothetical protein